MMLAAMKQLIEELAKEDGVSDANIRKWRSRGFVPHKYRAPMIAKAARRGRKLSLGDFQFMRASEVRSSHQQAAA